MLGGRFWVMTVVRGSYEFGGGLRHRAVKLIAAVSTGEAQWPLPVHSEDDLCSWVAALFLVALSVARTHGSFV